MQKFRLKARRLGRQLPDGGYEVIYKDQVFEPLESELKFFRHLMEPVEESPAPQPPPEPDPVEEPEEEEEEFNGEEREEKEEVAEDGTDISELSVAQVLALVAEGELDAEAALEAELQGRGRKTLVAALEAKIS